jgi:hypothetical protein
MLWIGVNSSSIFPDLTVLLALEKSSLNSHKKLILSLLESYLVDSVFEEIEMNCLSTMKRMPVFEERR